MFLGVGSLVKAAFHFALSILRLHRAGREDAFEGFLPGGEGLVEGNRELRIEN